MQKNISEENANNQKIIYSQNDESKATDGSSTEESTSLQEVSKQIEKLFKLNTELKGQILNLTKEINQTKTINSDLAKTNSDLAKSNSNLQNRMNIVEKKIKGLEALVIHNNINMDFISNRDSLKTLLLIVGVNLKVVSEPEIKSICQNFVSKVKFTKLILKILDNLSMKLNPKELPWRRGMEKEKNDQVLSEEEKKKIIHNIIFVECIHFIVCCIDNIVHPPDKIDNNENGNIYSKLMGKRSQDNLEKGLLQFFRNPNNIEDLLDFIGSEITPKKKETKKIEENSVISETINNIDDEIQPKIEETTNIININKKKEEPKPETETKNDSKEGKIELKNEINIPNDINEQNNILKKVEEEKNMESKEVKENKNNNNSNEENIQNYKYVKKNLDATKEENIEIKEVNLQKNGIKEEKELNKKDEEKIKSKEVNIQKTDLFNRDMNEKKEKKNSEIKQEETNTNENIKDNEKRNTNIKIPKNIDENLYNENIDIMQKANTIAFENYDLSKQYTYIQNKKFYEELNGKNEYIDKFYIQYLFDPNKNEFPGLNINYQEFKNKMDKEFEKFNNMKFDVKANELIKNLKWIS